jgi:hypothetical protein
MVRFVYFYVLDLLLDWFLLLGYLTRCSLVDCQVSHLLQKIEFECTVSVLLNLALDLFSPLEYAEWLIGV